MNKKSCVLCRNFISIYKINRTLHGHLGIRILSSGAEILSALEDKIRIPMQHVISSISDTFNRVKVHEKYRIQERLEHEKFREL